MRKTNCPSYTSFKLGQLLLSSVAALMTLVVFLNAAVRAGQGRVLFMPAARISAADHNNKTT
jgi:hypothetical protein